MHIPDGLMAPAVAAIGWGEFAIVISAVLFISRKRLQDKSLPRIAILSAGIFAAQMINFPIGGGTTGHLVGGALLAILVGPTSAMIGLTVVLIIQALMFGDGGITALGLNAVNMAIIAPLSGWAVHTMLSRGEVKGHSNIAIACAAWVSVFLAAAACAAELSVSFAISGGIYGISAVVSVPTVLGYHAVIGLGEAAITVGIMVYLDRVSPHMFARDDRRLGDAARVPRWWNVRAALAMMVVFALVLPLYFLYASDGKDGLEQTISNNGVGEGPPVLSSPFSYGQNYFEALFAGLLGFTAVGLALAGISRLLRPGALDR